MLAAVAVSMGSMIIGFSAAYTSPALVTMENSTTISITKEQVSNYKKCCVSKISQLETIKYVQVRLFICLGYFTSERLDGIEISFTGDIFILFLFPEYYGLT